MTSRCLSLSPTIFPPSFSRSLDAFDRWQNKANVANANAQAANEDEWMSWVCQLNIRKWIWMWKWIWMRQMSVKQNGKRCCECETAVFDSARQWQFNLDNKHLQHSHTLTHCETVTNLTWHTNVYNMQGLRQFLYPIPSGTPSLADTHAQTKRSCWRAASPRVTSHPAQRTCPSPHTPKHVSYQQTSSAGQKGSGTWQSCNRVKF